jgi:hypothetical protein
MPTKAELEAELERLRQLPSEHPEADQLEAAQGLISNAADWTSRLPESEEWRTAARRWLDDYGRRLHDSIAERDDQAAEPAPDDDQDPEAG